jgi:hypothetical protein
MSAWVAKKDQESVTEVFGDVAAQSLSCFRSSNLILGRDVTPLFRIKPRSYGRRLDEVAKQDRQMTALSVYRRSGV